MIFHHLPITVSALVCSKRSYLCELKSNTALPETTYLEQPVWLPEFLINLAMRSQTLQFSLLQVVSTKSGKMINLSFQKRQRVAFPKAMTKLSTYWAKCPTTI